MYGPVFNEVDEGGKSWIDEVARNINQKTECSGGREFTLCTVGRISVKLKGGCVRVVQFSCVERGRGKIEGNLWIWLIAE